MPMPMRSDINVTPLVDIGLVLLIVFIVLSPAAPRGYDVTLPAPPTGAPPATAPPPVQLRLSASGRMFVDGAETTSDDLARALAEVIARRGDATVAFVADDPVGYGDAIAVLDAARRAGARLGVVLGA